MDRVLVYIVAKCHEENLDHYLHSYIKVNHIEYRSLFLFCEGL